MQWLNYSVKIWHLFVFQGYCLALAFVLYPKHPNIGVVDFAAVKDAYFEKIIQENLSEAQSTVKVEQFSKGVKALTQLLSQKKNLILFSKNEAFASCEDYTEFYLQTLVWSV